MFEYEVDILGCTVRVGPFDVYPTSSILVPLKAWNWDESMVPDFVAVKPGQTTPVTLRVYLSYDVEGTITSDQKLKALWAKKS